MEREIFSSVRESVDSVGCKIFYQHPKGEHGRVWAWIANEKIPILCLRRRNWLDWYISYHLALLEDRWIGHSEEEAAYKSDCITIDPWSTIGRIRQMKSLEEKTLFAVRKCPVCIIEYEDLLLNFADGLRQAQTFLGLARMPFKGNTVKQRIRSRSEMISNWEFVRSCLIAETDLHSYLDDE
ncbi:MAG: hypothetical protein HC869_12400 [Rhodospirillales bacterium]|nr:hypothetical protein [Rhodospirillales bacterium]